MALAGLSLRVLLPALALPAQVVRAMVVVWILNRCPVRF